MQKILILCVVIPLFSCVNAKGPKFTKPDTASPGLSLLYIYRLDGYQSMDYPAIYIDGEKIGVLKQNGYLVAELSPGYHNVLVTGRDHQARWGFGEMTQEFRVKPDRTYYYKFLLTLNKQEAELFGNVIFRQWFRPIKPEDAEWEMQRTRLSES